MLGLTEWEDVAEEAGENEHFEQQQASLADVNSDMEK